MTAPLGSEVKITYDWDGTSPDGEGAPDSGDWLQTASGRTYLITRGWKVRSRTHPERYRYRCVVSDPGEIGSADRVFQLNWHPRKKKGS